ncbi:MAG: toll/interleukin-1 receptor domain-containing protein [Planctomycetota bacterium]|nr:toll/interleukin-1 receptor domain-containing protein [Planctomycetota bacterium]
MKYVFDLFISYVREDRVISIAGRPYSLLRNLKRTLEEHRHPDDSSRRFKVCTDLEDFELGQTVSTTIQENVQRSAELLVLASKNAAERPRWIEFEWRCFQGHRPDRRPLGVWIDQPPSEVFPDIFLPDDLVADLRPLDDQTEWEDRLLVESSRIVARVWDLPFARVLDRFQEEYRQTARAKAAEEGAMLAMLARTAWEGGDVPKAFRLARDSWCKNHNLFAQRLLFEVRDHPLQGAFFEPQPARSVRRLPRSEAFVAAHGAFERRPGYVVVRQLDGIAQTRIETKDQNVDAVVSPSEEYLVTRTGWGFGHCEAQIYRRSGERMGQIDHDDTIEDVAFTSDSARIFTGGADGTARLWSLKGEELLRLSDMWHVGGVACSPDGGILATASWDGKIRLFSIDGHPIREMSQGNEKLQRVWFDNSGKWLICTEYRFKGYVWTIEGELLAEVECAGDENPPGIALQQCRLAAGLGERLSVYDLLEPPQKRDTLEKHPTWIPFSSILNNLRKRVRSHQTRVSAPTLLTTDQPINSVHLSGDGTRIVARCNTHQSHPGLPTKGSLEVWSVDGRKNSVLAHNARVTGADISSGGEWAFSSCEDGGVRMFRIEQEKPLVIGGYPGLNDIQFLPEDEGVILAHADGRICIYDLNAILKNEFIHERHIARVEVDKRGCLLLGGHSDTATLCTVQGETIAKFRHPKDVGLVRFSNTQELILTTAYNTAYLWDRSGALKASLHHSDGGAMTCASFSPSDKYILTAGLDKTGARLWSLDGQLLAAFKGGEDVYVSTALFLSDGETVLVESLGAELLDISGTSLKRLTTWSHEVAVTPSNEVVVIPHSGHPVDSVAHLFSDLGEERAIFRVESPISIIIPTADGQRLIIGSEDGITLWDRSGIRLTKLHNGRVDRIRTNSTGGCIMAKAHFGDRVFLWSRCSPQTISEFYHSRFPEAPEMLD